MIYELILLILSFIINFELSNWISFHMPRGLRYLLPSQIGTTTAKNIPQCPALLCNLNGNGNFPLRTDSMNINTKTQTLKYLRSTFDLLVIGCWRGNITKIKCMSIISLFL